mmetsp:Transcript_24392/g.51901  ORF Transcript_24392/g.51901 Transcript_24392/m.51901 type:complete len:433 (-) Transcript_24392:139-1437(-)
MLQGIVFIRLRNWMHSSPKATATKRARGRSSVISFLPALRGMISSLVLEGQNNPDNQFQRQKRMYPRFWEMTTSILVTCQQTTSAAAVRDQFKVARVATNIAIQRLVPNLFRTAPVQLNAAANKSDDWFPSENIPDVDTHFQFENFDPQQSSSKKRHSSISSANFQAPPTDHFESSFPNNASAKENVAAKYNRLEAANDSWGMGGKRQSLRRQENPAVHNSVHDDDDDISGDDDSFDEIGEWKRPTTTYFERRMIGTQNTSLNRARLTRHEQHTSPYNRLSRNRYIDDYDDDEVRSASGFSVGKSSMASSRTKPLTLPSNAIMGSMLFQTQHDIDQSDVEQKINAFDRENSRQKDIRHSRGGIPDAVTADDDYMTTVSSFSESTSAYLQEPWRKPSRDLLNHFTSARTLDMDYRQRPIRTSRMEESQGLFEA